MGAFTFRHEPYAGQKDFDKFYITPIVNKVYKKVGDTDRYVETTEIILEKKDIAKEINSQAGEAGIQAYLKPYEVAGVDPTKADYLGVVDENIQDFSNMPEDLASAAAFGQHAQDLYGKLDPRLTKGQPLEQFLNNLNADTLQAYFEEITPKAPKVEEKGKEEK